jgi:hypothetical protein
MRQNAVLQLCEKYSFKAPLIFNSNNYFNNIVFKQFIYLVLLYTDVNSMIYTIVISNIEHLSYRYCFVI